MKFGIMTFHNIPNIGAILQAYSFCKIMRMKGQECYLVDYTCDNIRKRELIKKGYLSVPVIVVEGQDILGFDLTRIKQLTGL